MTAILTVFVSFLTFAAAHADAVSVFTGGDADLDACSETADVKLSDPYPGNGLNVRVGPGLEHDATDFLSQGDQVLICDYRFGPDWVGIIYSSDGLVACGLGTPEATRQPYAGPCMSGWVARRYLATDQ